MCSVYAFSSNEVSVIVHCHHVVVFIISVGCPKVLSFSQGANETKKKDLSGQNHLPFAKEHSLNCSWTARGWRMICSSMISMTKPQCQNENVGSRFYRHWSVPFVQGMTPISPYPPPLSKWLSFSQQKYSYDGDNWQRYNNRRHNDSDYWQGNLGPQRDRSVNEWTTSWWCGSRKGWCWWTAESGLYWKKNKFKLYVAQNLLTGDLHLLKRQK